MTLSKSLDPDNLSDFMASYQSKLHELNKHMDFGAMKQDQDVAKTFLSELRECKPLAVTLPEEYGGHGVCTQKLIQINEITGYVSLSFSLLFGINSGLFIQPILKYGSKKLKDEILGPFLSDENLGGLMVTEPGHGTDALKMRTKFTQSNGTYDVSGMKCWAGLTGWADNWIVAARTDQKDGTLGRDISLFVCDQSQINVEEYYSNLGLSVLPYGRNKIEATLDSSRRLQAEGSGIRMMQDFFHRSRLQFSGMAIGYLKRIRDEALKHCRNRSVAGSPLVEYENVRQELSILRASTTIAKAMCVYTSENVKLHENLAKEVIVANSIKALVTDLMQEAADAYLQLCGANGYRSDHLAGQSYVDARPFQIFEGPNDVLYDQIAKAAFKEARGEDLEVLSEYLDFNDNISNQPTEIYEQLHMPLDQDYTQSQRMAIGKILARLVALRQTATLQERGMVDRHYQITEHVLVQEINCLINQAQSTMSEQTFQIDESPTKEWTEMVK